MSIVLVFQIDFNKSIKYKLLLKDFADDSVAAASLHIDQKEYGEGKKIYDYQGAISTVNELLTNNMKTTDFSYVITFEDDSNTAKTFDNTGKMLNEKSPTAPYPTITLVLKGKDMDIRTNMLKLQVPISVISTYEYVTH